MHKLFKEKVQIVGTGIKNKKQDYIKFFFLQLWYYAEQTRAEFPVGLVGTQPFKETTLSLNEARTRIL